MNGPDWREWKHTPDVTVWQACALSMNIEPRSMRPTENGWMGGYGSPLSFMHTNASEKEEFELRQRVLMANLSRESLDAQTPNRTTVRLSLFAFFAVSIVKWEGLPPELVALADVPKREEAPATTMPDAAPDPTYATPSRASEKAASEVVVLRKRSAFIAQFSGMWPTIKRDLGDSGRNDLSKVAKDKKHGFWNVREALKWAAERGKIQRDTAEIFVRAEGESEISVLVRAMLNQAIK